MKVVFLYSDTTPDMFRVVYPDGTSEYYDGDDNYIASLFNTDRLSQKELIARFIAMGYEVIGEV